MSRALAHLFGLVGTLQAGVESRVQGGKDRGATAVEYGLLVGLIAVVIIVGVTALGGKLDDLFTNISTSLPTG